MVHQRGFSLVEMLVVLFVIVLMTGLVSLNVNSGAGDRELQDKLAALQSVASYALDEAQFSGMDFGVLFIESINGRGDRIVTAHWRQRLPQGWRLPERSVDIFKAIEIPATAELQLFLEGSPVDPVAVDAETPLSGATPQWVFLASGETQAGELFLSDASSGETLWRLDWDALARFEQYRGDDDQQFGTYAQSP